MKAWSWSASLNTTYNSMIHLGYCKHKNQLTRDTASTRTSKWETLVHTDLMSRGIHGTLYSRLPTMVVLAALRKNTALYCHKLKPSRWCCHWRVFAALASSFNFGAFQNTWCWEQKFKKKIWLLIRFKMQYTKRDCHAVYRWPSLQPYFVKVKRSAKPSKCTETKYHSSPFARLEWVNWPLLHQS